ncbi:MAG: pilus assembly protein PilM [Candidatus Magnetomorum sp.]|nr:pilus assembly protein PilM [Candidatus Magnetomorum sp.]
MLPDDEITSTEQLLTLIRNNSVQNDAIVVESSPEPPSKVSPTSEHVTIGVDIREKNITLVKIGPSTKTNWKLIDCLQETIPEKKEIAVEGISSKELSRCIGDFLGSAKRYQLWAFVSSEKTDVRYLLIPKVQEKQLTNTVYWSAKKEMDLNEESVFFDFEVLGDITQKGVGKTAVVAYAMPRSQITAVKDLFSSAGYPLTGISIPEFSTQSLLRGDLLSGAGDTVATLNIGSSYSKISIYRRGNLTLTRRIKTCLNSMSESLVDSIKESYFNLTQTDNHTLSVDYARNLLLKNISETSGPEYLEDDSDTGADQSNIFDGIYPAVERLARQIERTFQHFNTLFKEDVIQHLYIEGDVSRFKPLNEYISSQLNISVSPLNVISPGVPQFVEYKANHPQEFGEKYTSAIGLAMSDYQQAVPNFLLDYRDKERMNLNSRINKGIRIGLTIAVILCFCLLLFQILDSRHNANEIKEFKEKLTSFGPRVDQNLILKEAARMKNLYKSQKKIAIKYLGLATITELIERNPAYIRLNRIRLDMGPLTVKKRKSETAKRAVIEGTVFKEKLEQKGRDHFETSLANYMLSLENSPIFSSPSIRGKSFEYIDRYGEVLIFELHLLIQSQSEPDSE